MQRKAYLSFLLYQIKLYCPSCCTVKLVVEVQRKASLSFPVVQFVAEVAGVGRSALDVGLEHVVLHDGVAAACVCARLSLARQHRLLRGVVHAAMRLRTTEC